MPEMNSKWKISVWSCATLKMQPWTRNAEKRIFLNPFFRKTGTKIKILIPTFFGQNLYLTNPQVSFGSKQNWGTSSILKFLTIFQFFGLKTLKMVKKFKIELVPQFYLDPKDTWGIVGYRVWPKNVGIRILIFNPVFLKK